MSKQAGDCDRAAGELIRAANNLSAAAAKYRNGDGNGGADEMFAARGRVVKAEKILNQMAEDRVAPPPPPPEPPGCFLDAVLWTAVIGFAFVFCYGFAFSAR